MKVFSSLEVLTVDNAELWTQVLEEIGTYDLYHLSSYHLLAEMRGEGKALLPVFRDGRYVIAFPMLVRSIGLIESLGERLKDATSVHGYPGPVSSSADIPEDVRERFQQSLMEFFDDQGIIAAFSRLHPVLIQSQLLEGLGEVVNIGVTVSIDLTVMPDVQLANYRKSHRYEIERLKKLGFTCEEVGPEYLEDFIRIYYDTMDKVSASTDYYYGREYFEYLLNEMSDVMHLFVCKDGDTIACAALFGVCNGMMQYHLAGTEAGYRRLSPMKLMLDAVRRWGNDIGAHTFHLGGGVGAQRDALYEFKRGFCEREHTFSGWKCLVNRPTYEEICREVIQYTGTEPSGSYFPAYRDPSLMEAFNGNSSITNPIPNHLPHTSRG